MSQNGLLHITHHQTDVLIIDLPVMGVSPDSSTGPNSSSALVWDELYARVPIMGTF